MGFSRQENHPQGTSAHRQGGPVTRDSQPLPAFPKGPGKQGSRGVHPGEGTAVSPTPVLSRSSERGGRDSWSPPCPAQQPAFEEKHGLLVDHMGSSQAPSPQTGCPWAKDLPSVLPLENPAKERTNLTGPL